MVIVFTILTASLVSVAFAWAVSAGIRIWSIRPEEAEIARLLANRRFAVRRVLAPTSRAGDDQDGAYAAHIRTPSYDLGSCGSSGIPAEWLDDLWARRN